MQWDFESIKKQKYLRSFNKYMDTIEGNFEETAGVADKGLRLDGFTTHIICK